MNKKKSIIAAINSVWKETIANVESKEDLVRIKNIVKAVTSLSDSKVY